jgi:UDP-GlcNAc:undecaprenyl-phosphate GlcNAc-1-phosphate transferase
MSAYGDYAAVFAIAAAATFLLTFPVRSLAVRVGALAQPGEDRMHLRPTPVIGGAAMVVAFGLTMFAASRIAGLSPVFSSSEPLGVVLGALLIFGVGLIDDVRDISAPAKVAGQVLAAMVLVSLGVTMYYFKFPFFSPVLVLSPSVLPLITAVWVVGMANAVNLIDGLDGLAAGIVCIGSGALCVYGLQLVHLGDLSPDNPGPLIAAITCGVCLGFLPHNFHPARVFMGDGGALTLGLLMAASTMVIGGRTENVVGAGVDVTGLTFFRFAPLFIPVFILGVPILDTAFAIVRRTVRRSGVAARDLGHLHHRLVRLGHGHRRAVVILWGWTAVLCCFVLLPAFDSRANAVVPIGVGLLVLGLYTLFEPGTTNGSRLLALRLSRRREQVDVLAGTDGPHGPPIQVSVSGSAGVAVAGEPDLSRPRRRRHRRKVHSRFARRRAPDQQPATRLDSSGREPDSSRVARPEKEMPG